MAIIEIFSDDDKLASGEIMQGCNTISDVASFLTTHTDYYDGLENNDIEDWDYAWVTMPDSSCWTITRNGKSAIVEESNYPLYSSIISREEYECMDDDEREVSLKIRMAESLCEYGNYPRTMQAIQETVAECFGDEWESVFDSTNAEQLANLYKVAKFAYEKGRAENN